MGNYTYFNIKAKINKDLQEKINKLKEVDKADRLTSTYIGEILELKKVPERLDSIISASIIVNDTLMVDMSEYGLKDYDDAIPLFIELVYKNMEHPYTEKEYGNYRYDSSRINKKFYKGEIVDARDIAPYHYKNVIFVNQECASYVDELIGGCPWLKLTQDTPKLLLDVSTEDSEYYDLAKGIKVEDNAIELDLKYSRLEPSIIEELITYLEKNQVV